MPAPVPVLRSLAVSVTLILGAGPAETETFDLAQAISDVVERHHPRIRILVVPTLGSARNAELLGAGELDLATIQAEMQTPPSARLIAPLFADAFQLLAREGSEVRSPGDLGGKTVALPVRGSAGRAQRKPRPWKLLFGTALFRCVRRTLLTALCQPPPRTPR